MFSHSEVPTASVCQRPSWFHPSDPSHPSSPEKSLKILMPVFSLKACYPSLGFDSISRCWGEEYFCCRNTIHNFKTTWSHGGRKAHQEERLRPWYSGQRNNSTRGHLPRETLVSQQESHVSSYEASRGGGVSWPPVRMLSSRLVTDPILQVWKSPGLQTPKITASQETASVLRERERLWLGVGRGCCTHLPTQPLPPWLHGVPAWCQEQGSDSGQQGPAGWKSLKQLETQEIEEWI